jgi:Flp pilus assembly protein TadG
MVDPIRSQRLSRRVINRLGRRKQGTAMIEFIFVLPLLLLMVFGIMEFSILFSRLQTLSNAAREGARDAIVFRTNCNAGAVVGEVQTTVVNYAASGGVTVTPADITVTGACSGTGNDTTVQVINAYAFQVVRGFAPGLAPSLNVTGTSVMRNE